MNYLSFNITKDDIKNGIRNLSTACPVARAIRRVLGGEEVEVFPSYVHAGAQIYVCSSKLRAFIRKFDYEEEECFPESFVLKRIVYDED